MDTKSILGKISSKYNLENIFDYIGNDFKMKLFVHSKFFQKKLDIELFDYQELYLKKLNIKLSDYFSIYSGVYGYPDNFDKNCLKNKLKADLKNKIDTDIFIEKFDTKYFEKLNIGFKNLGKFNFIDINSPFFYPISLTECFGELFIIPIETLSLEKHGLQNDYKIALKNLDQSNSKYFSIHFSYNNANDINHLSNFKNLFKKIKYLEIKPHKNSTIKEHDVLLKNLFSFDDIVNNLLSLKIYFGIIKLEANTLNNLNNFKNLEELILGGFKLKDKFILKLNNLKILSLTNCINFILEENSLLNLKKLNLAMCLIHSSDSLIKLPKVEEMKLENNNYKIKYDTIFDFFSFVNLKILYCDIDDFMNLQKTKLEILKIRVYNNIPFDKEKLMLEKYISIKTLKEIQFWLMNLNNDDIAQINGINESVNKISLLYSNTKLDFCVYELQNKFPNLSEISIDTSHIFNQYNGDLFETEIKENENSKVKKISIIENNSKHIQLYCKSYNSLESLYFDFQYKVKNFENIIGIFNNDNKIVFESLKSFSLNYEYYELNTKYLENICDNLDYMPNLEEFSLICLINRDFTEDLFIIFITKLLASKLISINLEFKSSKYDNMEYYSVDELKKIFPNINKLERKKIYIKKCYFKY